ncbi:hypothetical protein GGR28_003770 [Lewinella aquimaris]|uniref:Uncharacterized protein n=1 Tax=Neolewinella aquimaris TaxID=1835722 RepID=A0A840EB06_9BACT|nr:hypothetical protein [Neolewinella aquimaris]MBB4081123.1 hypothetical protein [Neolewinella aquimaris]
MINVDGETKRGFGASFEISMSKFASVFFERRINEDKVKVILGRQLTDDEIEELSDHYAETHWLCLNCEKKLERIESYFEKQCFKKLFTEIVPQKPGQECYSIDGSTGVFRLFIYSILWRMHNRGLLNFQLSKRVSNSLRHILNKNLDLEIKEVIKNCEQNIDGIAKYPLSVITTQYFADVTANLVHVSRNKIPRILVINEYVIIFFERAKQINSSDFNFYGLTKSMIQRCCNHNEDRFHVTVIPSKFFDEVRTAVWQKKASDFILELKKKYSQISYMAFRQPKNEDLSNDFVQVFLEGDLPETERYSIEHVKKSLLKFYGRQGLIR